MSEPPLDLDALEALAEAATPGPWEYGDRWHVAGVMPERFGEGKCSGCERHGEPTWVGKQSINGKRMLAHVHTSEQPWHPHGMFAVRDDGPVSVINDTDEYGYLDPADAAFIAAARSAVPALVQRVRELEAGSAAVQENNRLREQNRDLRSRLSAAEKERDEFRERLLGVAQQVRRDSYIDLAERVASYVTRAERYERERDALQSRLDAVKALKALAEEHWDWKAGQTLHRRLKEALGDA